MENGWIKLYRCSIGSRVFNNEGLLKVWIWCLLKANHSTQWVNLKTGRGSIEVECKDGQFIFGRNSAAKELDMDGGTVYKRMQKLKNMENLTIESNKQYSLITIMNWHTYQALDNKSNSKGNKQVTGKQQASNTNKNDKNEKNEKKNPLAGFEDFYKAYPKKKSKGQAEKTWNKLSPTNDLLKQMLISIEAARKSEDWLKENGKFIPYPSSWLNSKGWEDEIIEPKDNEVVDRTTGETIFMTDTEYEEWRKG